METVLVILLVVATVLNVINAVRNFRQGRTGLAIVYIAGAVLWCYYLFGG